MSCIEMNYDTAYYHMHPHTNLQLSSTSISIKAVQMRQHFYNIKSTSDRFLDCNALYHLTSPPNAVQH